MVGWIHSDSWSIYTEMMETRYDENSFGKIIAEIIERGYDMNYASVLASDYVFEENPEVEFSDEFSKRYGVVMDYFLNAQTQISSSEFTRVIDDLNKIACDDYISQENLISILYKNEIQSLGHFTRKVRLVIMSSEIRQVSYLTVN